MTFDLRPFLDGTWSKRPDLLRHLTGHLGKPLTLGCTHVVHLHSPTAQPHLFQQRLHILNPLLGPEVPPQKMTLSLQTARQINPIHSRLKCLQNQNRIHPSRTGNLHDLHIRRVVEPHRTCQVRRTVGSMLATESQNFWFEDRKARVVRRQWFLTRHHFLLGCFHAHLIRSLVVS